MDNNQIISNNQTRKEYHQNIIFMVEDKIQNNQFRSKEELTNYLIDLRNRGVSETILSNEKMQELLSLYDGTKNLDEPSLNMENYKGVSLEEQNLIISKQTDTILKTESSPEELPKDFVQVQNEITVNKQDGLANANEVFEHMKNNQKEEVSIIGIDEVINRDNIDSEVLNKIKFFITNKYINPHEYHVSPETGIFYNMETNEVLEVRKDEKTGKYVIHKGGEIVYGENNTQENINEQSMTYDTIEKESDTNKEEMIYENRFEKENIKVRRLIKISDYNNRAAFAKTGFLLIGIIAFSIVTATIILLNK